METRPLYIDHGSTLPLDQKTISLSLVGTLLERWSKKHFDQTETEPVDKYEVDKRAFDRKTEVLECWIDAKGRRVQRIKVEGGRIYTKIFKKNGELERLTIDHQFIN